MKTTALTASLLLFAACDGSEASSDHDHDHDRDHAHADHGHAAPGGPIEARTGGLTVRLEPAADTLRVSVTDTDGQPVSPSGEARMVLTGTGESQQRIVLKPDGAGWSGAAKAEGAPGYIAVVSFLHAGQSESVRLTWGEVPALEPSAAPPADEAEPSDDHGHDHGHGH